MKKKEEKNRKKMKKKKLIFYSKTKNPKGIKNEKKNR